MKTILIAIVTLACAAGAFAGQRFEAAAWRGVQTYDVPALLQQQGSLLGKIVAVRFNYRSAKLRHLQPSWYQASLWQRDPKAKKGFSALRVMVAKKDITAFQTITSDFQSAGEVTSSWPDRKRAGEQFCLPSRDWAEGGDRSERKRDGGLVAPSPGQRRPGLLLCHG